MAGRGIGAVIRGWASSLSRSMRRAPDAAKPKGTQFAIYPGVIQNSPRPWARALPASDWLGQYTPPWVPYWILKIMREDPQLSLGMGAIKSVFFGIDYRFSGGDPKARAFLNKTIIEAPWFDRLKLSILNSLDFGFQSHELLWDMQDVLFDEDGPGGTEPTNLLEANVVDDFVDLDPEEVSTIDIDKYRQMTGITLGGQLLSVSIPAEKVLHATHLFEWSNHWGNSQLKRAYLPFLWVNHLSGHHVRYMEGKANPPYKGTAPVRQLTDDAQSLAQVGRDSIEVLSEQMTALRGGGAAALPWEPDEKGNNKWSIEVLQDSGRADMFVTSINHLQALKLRAIWLPDRAATQDTATGSFAMADAHIELFLSILEGVKRNTILRAISELGRRVVRANYGKTTSMPSAVGSDLSRQKQALMAELVKLSLDVPLTLDDGRTYTPKQCLNFRENFRSLNIPALDPKEVARKKPPAPEVPTKPLNPDQVGIKGAEDEMRRRDREVIELRSRLTTLEGRASINVSVPERETHLHVEAAPAPPPPSVVNNITVPEREVVNNITVPERSVNVQNDVTVPERSVTVEGAQVNVTTPPVNVSAPTVNVDVEVKGGSKSITFKTDQAGDIKSAEIRPQE